MTVADHDAAELADINFEALKGGYSQRSTRDGDKVAITLLLDPEDVPPVLATARLGSRFKVGMLQIGDDERPIRRRSPSRPPPPGSDEVLSAIKAAHVYANDRRFWAWAKVEDYESAMDFIHTECGVPSCRMFRDTPAAVQAFNNRVRWPYLIATNQMVAPR